MIYNETKLKVSDNSGARIAKCLYVYRHKVGSLGLTILVSIKLIKSQTKLKRGSLHKAIIVRTKLKTRRCEGNFIFF